MLKADELNKLNGSPAFGVSKFADRTEKGQKLDFVFLMHFFKPNFEQQRSLFYSVAREMVKRFQRSSIW